MGIGALAIPGLDPLITAEPILATLAGVGLGGAVAGFSGVLVGLGIPEYEVKHYEGRLQKAGILLSVHCGSSDEIDNAKGIMEHSPAEDISVVRESSTGSKSSETEEARQSGSATELFETLFESLFHAKTLERDFCMYECK